MSRLEPERISEVSPDGTVPPSCAPLPPVGVQRKPPWLRISLRETDAFRDVRRLTRGLQLTTVCEEARCPNIYECWGEHRTATFMLFGEICTRRCGFCAVATGLPGALDPLEPQHLAQAVQVLALQHAVITSVNRDDLPDGGAAHFAETLRQVRALNPLTRLEVLIPDFQGREADLATVLEARPDVLAHNLETVPRLYRKVRVGAKYPRSLELLRRVRKLCATGASVITKTGLMVGLGETEDELLQVMDDLRAHDVDVLTLGQYLRPTHAHLPVIRYYAPKEFSRLREAGLARGFKHVEAGPLVRSSYHAHAHVPALEV